MRLVRPDSILGLILTGYLLALLPLVLALGWAVIQVKRLTEQSQITVFQVVEATQGGRLLSSQLTAMERSARQYLVLRDDKLLDVYREAHAAFARTLERLNALKLEKKRREILQQIGEVEQGLFEIFAYPREKPMVIEVRVAEFGKLLELVRDFLNQSANWVDREVMRLQTLAEEATLRLSWLMFAVIPAVLVLTGIFTILIVRPLQRMVRAIHRLGREDFTRPIVVHGPRDLEAVGKRLDWLRSRLAELNDQKVRFLRHVSHELKTPLTALREGAELLSDQIIGPLNFEQREVAAILRGNSVQLQRLIEDLLNFNQALSRNLKLRTEIFEFDKLVKQVIATQRMAWKARKLQLITYLTPLLFNGDREKLATLVDNLLSNAIKFSPLGGTITIELNVVGDRVQLKVKDSGPGFDPRDRTQVFEAFYQGHTVADGHVKGSGLGLAIAREYALAHQGQLEIVDEPSETGGCVLLSLPLLQEAN